MTKRKSIKPAVHKRKASTPVTQILMKKDENGDPYLYVFLFVFGMLTFISQGATIIAPLMWLGVL